MDIITIPSANDQLLYGVMVPRKLITRAEKYTPKRCSLIQAPVLSDPKSLKKAPNREILRSTI